MFDGAPTSTKERVLVVEPVWSVAQRAAAEVFSSGGEAVVVQSAAEARRAGGGFDCGLLSFNLPDGNGVVLAAELMLDDLVREVRFFHPNEEVEERAGPPSEAHARAHEAISVGLARSA